MPRSSWKPPYIESALLARALKDEIQTAAFATRSRSTYILPEFIGKLFEVHNGKRFIRLRVTEDMVGHRFGEFAPTRKPCAHKHRR